ncbi:MAG TPA: PQQ-binding-like beta-propeller repeat protein, partial [Tepidisphaeraceae bacterium]|nr:PQQ-binding-like beta-propeller repeat protein [Tepidisphaeraceae bacterium]
MRITALFMLMAVAAGACAAPASSADWPAFHNGGGLRGVGAPVGAPPMKVRWTYFTDETEPAGIEGGAAIVGDTAYAGDGAGGLHAVDLKTGKARWVYKSENGFATTPLVLNGRVFIGDISGVFHCVSADKGEKVWAVDTQSPIKASSNALGERIVFGNDGAEIYCLDAKTGKELWKATAGDRVNATPAIVNGLALVSGCDAKLRGIDVQTGEEKFAADLGALAP